MKTDINTPADISFLVNAFYEKVQKDPSLRPFFQHLDWEQHLPKMKQFWRFLLLNEPGYTTNVTEKHVGLPLTRGLFKVWVALFNETVDENFEGLTANLAKEKAHLIAVGIQAKMNLLEEDSN